MPGIEAVEDPWMAAMRRGDFEEAWRISDAVLRQRQISASDCSSWPRHLQFVWRGAPVEQRRVLVRCYHGLGDTIQFVRFLAPLRVRAAHVAVWVQPPLIRLLKSAAGIDELLPLHDGTPDVCYDVDLELMELPHVLRVTALDLPGPIPYLGAPRSFVSPAAAQKLRIGLVWRSGDWDQRRSIAAQMLTPLQQLEKVDWYSLQFPPEPLPFPAASLGCRDIFDMAARMQGLDAIVSVDTMAAHLAGALGLEVFTLIPYAADWRWMAEGENSPWYPTMHLLRQPAPGAWTPVIDRLTTLLDALRGARSC